MSLLLEAETRVLRRCFFDVQNEVGVGREEQDYHQAINIWLRENEVPFSSKRPHSLTLYGHQTHRLFPDLVAWGEITIELKSVARTPGSAEYVQLFDYLKCRGDRLGLLVNMNRARSYMKALGLKWGIAVNYGKSQVEINGMRMKDGRKS